MNKISHFLVKYLIKPSCHDNKRSQDTDRAAMDNENTSLELNNSYKIGGYTYEEKPKLKTKPRKWSKLAAVLPITYMAWWMLTLPTAVVPLLRSAFYEGTPIPWPQNIGIALFLGFGIPSQIVASILGLIYLDL